MRDHALPTKTTGKTQARPSPSRSLRLWIVERDWALDLLGESLTQRLLRPLLRESGEPLARALRQVDRLPEWYDVLACCLENPAQEAAALEAMARAPRLDGPYAACILRDCLQRRVRAALRSDQPTDALWAVSLDATRWASRQPRLGSLLLAVPDPRVRLPEAAERLREIVRLAEDGGSITPRLRAAALAWPDLPD